MATAQQQPGFDLLSQPNLWLLPLGWEIIPFAFRLLTKALNFEEKKPLEGPPSGQDWDGVEVWDGGQAPGAQLLLNTRL